jgi:FHA domain
MATLRITSGPLAGQKVEVDGDVTIGRQNADLTIDDAQLSRRHAVLRQLAGGLEVEDLGSSNGTFVDGRRIEAPTPVPAGAKVKLGVTVLELDVSPSADATQIVAPSSRDETRVWSGGGPKRGTMTPTPAAGRAPRGDVPAPPEPAAPAVAAASPHASSAPVGEFHPPARRRRARLASRSWVPVALSYGSVVLTAVALVIYFAAR